MRFKELVLHKRKTGISGNCNQMLNTFFLKEIIKSIAIILDGKNSKILFYILVYRISTFYDCKGCFLKVKELLEVLF